VSIKITILGCGAAGGVPSISEGWGQCNPANPKNNRRRASILVQDTQSQVLIDASPDLRAQLLDCGVSKLDGVVFTHAHADHLNGLDELREVNRVLRAPLDVYANSETLRDMRLRFGYAFDGIPPGEPIFRPWLVAHHIGEASGDTFMVKTLQVKTFLQDHGFSTTLGLRFGDVVYSTDVVELPDAAKAAIRGAQVWIVGAIGFAHHPTHAHLDKVLGWVKELQPRRTVITHMGPKMDYDVVNAHCPAGVTAAFDGMTIEA
jgi:phosphoribosyl 1,2-cyclic phosphate phosphodiesterase